MARPVLTQGGAAGRLARETSLVSNDPAGGRASLIAMMRVAGDATLELVAATVLLLPGGHLACERD